MQFYQVSSDWLYSPVLLRIEHKYGLPGIGFYWKVIAAFHLAAKPLSEIYLLTLRGRGLQWKEAAELLHHTPEIFVRDAQGNYLLSDDDVATGLHKGEVSALACIYAMRMQTDTQTGVPTGTQTRTEAGTEASTGTDAQTGTQTGDAQVIVDSKREEKIRLEEKAENEFYAFMQEHCPHLQLMAEPMTFSELRLLREHHSIREIREVLSDMENKPGIETTWRSCYKTARKWLERK